MYTSTGVRCVRVDTIAVLQEGVSLRQKGNSSKHRYLTESKSLTHFLGLRSKITEVSPVRRGLDLQKTKQNFK